MVGISTDNLDTQTRFAESLDLEFPLVADEDKSVSDAYGTLNALRRASTRQTFGIGSDGQIVYHNADVKPRDMAGYRAIQEAFGIEPEGG